MGQAILPVAAIGSLVLNAAKTAATIQAQRQAAAAARARYEYEAAIAANNQIIQQRLAADAIARGEREAERHGTEIRQIIGAQRAAFAGAGVEVDEGTALDTVLETAEIGAVEQEIIRSNAEREAYEHRTQGHNFDLERRLSLARASQSRANWLPTALGGAADLFGQFAIYKKNKIF